MVAAPELSGDGKERKPSSVLLRYIYPRVQRLPWNSLKRLLKCCLLTFTLVVKFSFYADDFTQFLHKKKKIDVEIQQPFRLLQTRAGS